MLTDASTIYSSLLLQRTSMSKTNFVHSLRVQIWVFTAIRAKFYCIPRSNCLNQSVLGHMPRCSGLTSLLLYLLRQVFSHRLAQNFFCCHDLELLISCFCLPSAGIADKSPCPVYFHVIFIFICGCVCAPHACSACRYQKRALNFPGTALNRLQNYHGSWEGGELPWGEQESNLGSPGRATSVPHGELSLQLLQSLLLFAINMDLIPFLSGCTLEGAVFSTVLGVSLLVSLGPFRHTQRPKSE